MATEPILIKVTKDGDKEAAQGIRAIGTEALDAGVKVDTMNSFLGVLKTTLGALGIGVAVRELQQQADAYTSIINRLKLVSTSQADLVKTEQQLFNISQQTRGSFETTANLYNKLALSAGQLGIDTKSLLPTIQTINQAIAISGTTSEEARAGLLQFSQALASNRLQGDELRSVLENLPFLGQAIAKGLGTTTAGLRLMGEQGQLSSKLILDALEKQAPEIQKQFATLTPTIGQAFQVLQNSFLRFIGLLDQTNGVSRTLAQGILFLGNNLATIANTLGVATAAFVAFKTAATLAPIMAAFAAGIARANLAVQGYVQIMGYAGLQTTVFSRLMVALNTPIAAIRTALLSLWAVVAANPFTILVTVIAAVTAAVYLFGNSIQLTSDGSITLLGAVIGIWRSLGDIITFVKNLLAPFIGPIWTAMYNAVAPVINLLITGFQTLGSILVALFPQLQGTGGIIDTLVDNMKNATKELNNTGLAAADLGKQFGGDNLGGGSYSVASGATKASKGVDNLIDGLLQMGRIDPKLQWQAWGKVIDDWDRQQQKAMQNAKKQMQDYIAEVDRNTAETQKMALVTRNAFGDMITASDEWARRTGANFNAVAQAASSSLNSISSSSDSIGSIASSGGKAGGSNGLNSAFGDTPRGDSTGAGYIGHFSDAMENYFRFGAAYILRQGVNPNQLLLEAKAVSGQQGPNLLAYLLNDKLLFPDQDAAKVTGHNLNAQGFANGGSFMVGGQGGTDSQLVQFMASPNERVTIETPSQQRNRGGNGGRNVTVNMTVQTPDANSFRRSNTQVLLALKSKLNGVSGQLI